MEIATSLRAIQECFPQLEVRRIEFLAEGWDSVAWEVNEELIFRFPKRPAAERGLEKEIRLLPELAPPLSIPIPRFEYVSEGCPAFPHPFVGYPKLPGVQLKALTPTPEELARLAPQLGRFLSELHSFPVERAVELGVPSYDFR